jgi:outer membrane receptor for ferrienterochelin and colicin
MGQSDSLSGEAFIQDIFSIIKEDSSSTSSITQSSVSGYFDEDIRQAPGTVRVITAEQIQAMSATDLMDVIMATPGMNLGRDVDDVIGIGMRGLWAHEGKVQFMLNGMPLNDLDFGSFALGGRIPLDNISRIEIMNGPGSIIFGGTAALGVINVITKTPLEMSGSQISYSTGYSNGYSSLNQVGISSNQRIGKDTYLSFNASFNNSLRSTWQQAINDSTSLSLGDSTQINCENVFFGITHKAFKSQFFLNDYTYKVSDAAYGVTMRSMVWDNEYQMNLGKRVRARIKGTYFYQMPWFNINSADPDLLSTNTNAQKLATSILFDIKLAKNLTWSAGAQAYAQEGTIFSRQYSYSISSNNSVMVYDLSAFGEFTFKSKMGVVKFGGRIETNTLSPLLSAPRFSYTKTFGRVYAKAMAANAFKIPTVQNVNLGPTDVRLKNENIQTNEITIGYKGKGSRYCEITFFQTAIDNPIVYVSDTIQFDNYINRQTCGTHGFEFATGYNGKRFFVNAGYSFYMTQKDRGLSEIELPQALGRSYLGMPQNKFNVALHFEISQQLSLNTSFVYQSHYCSSTPSLDENSTANVIQEQPSTALLNAGLRYTPARFGLLSTTLSCNNILNQMLVVSSAYQGGQMPMALYHRQINLTISIRFK